MEWRDEGILLTTQRHGETAAIIDVLTRHHGRARGLVRGGAGKRYASTLQPGNELQLTWRARTADQLGSFSAELVTAHSYRAMSEREALAVLDALRSMALTLLPESDASSLYERTCAIVRTLDNEAARRIGYAKWEVSLLADLGFALDLSRCAATGRKEGLAYVSPRTGRAVSEEAGAPYAPRLLALPEFLLSDTTEPTREDFGSALTLTSFFLKRWALNAIGKEALPDARQRLQNLLA